MSRKPNTPVKDFFTGMALLFGVCVFWLVFRLIAFLLFAGLVFLGLTMFTNWDLTPRIGSSVLSGLIAMKVFWFVSEIFDLVPRSWLEGKGDTKPCPECGKNLRTARAQQCFHCGADWHPQV